MSSPPSGPLFVVPEAPPQGLLQLLLRLLLFCALTGLVGMVTVGLGIYLHFAPTVPQFDSIHDYQPKVGTRIYSADNQLIGEFAIERRVLVPSEKMPPLLPRAFMAAEDKRFYTHGGIDMVGVLQAIVGKVIHPREKLRGASTITQQVAKSLLATHETYESATERSLNRKVREAILARHLEKTLTKDQILYMYLTQTFLGHKAYGVGAAAEHYFRKNVDELTIAEMATMAGLPQRPSDYSPVTRPEAALGRRKYVLRRMLEDGYITREQHQQASAEKLTVYPREELYLQVAPHYTEQVRRELMDRYGERAVLEDGLEVYSAINLERQHLGQQAIDKGLGELDKRQGFRGPLAHIDSHLRVSFSSKYREELGWHSNTVELTPDTPYLGLVLGINAKGDQAAVDIAGKSVILPLAAMRWARKPNPMERVDFHYITDIHQALSVGDIIWVTATNEALLARDEHAQKVLKTLPKSGVLVALEQEPVTEAAIVSVDARSGYVEVQIGGYNFDESSYNRAVQACREPGSAFKPAVYSAAIDKFDYSASTLIDDKPLVYDDPNNSTRWKPNNAGEQFRGRLPMRTCLKDSINTPAIRIAEAVGMEDVIKNARRLGISTPMKRELGTALGSSCTTLMDLMTMYVTLANYGERRENVLVRRVVDRYGNLIEDSTVSWDPTIDFSSRIDRAFRRVVTPPRQVLDVPTAFVTVSLLKNVVAAGTGIGASRIGQIVAGKTGTTNDSYDAWFMGFTRFMVTGVWVGHDRKERPLGVNEQGGKTALPLWVDLMQNALVDHTVSPPRRIVHGDFVPPPGVISVSIDPDTGLLARPNSGRTVSEWYREGTEPTEYTPDKAVLNPSEVDVFKADSPF